MVILETKSSSLIKSLGLLSENNSGEKINGLSVDSSFIEFFTHS